MSTLQADIFLGGIVLAAQLIAPIYTHLYFSALSLSALSFVVPDRFCFYGAVLPRRRPHYVLMLSVCLSVCPSVRPSVRLSRAYFFLRIVLGT